MQSPINIVSFLVGNKKVGCGNQQPKGDYLQLNPNCRRAHCLRRIGKGF